MSMRGTSGIRHDQLGRQLDRVLECRRIWDFSVNSFKGDYSGILECTVPGVVLCNVLLRPATRQTTKRNANHMKRGVLSVQEKAEEADSLMNSGSAWFWGPAW